MASLYAYCDESGKHTDHKIIVFNGLVDEFKNWLRFGEEWARLLRRYELTSFHAMEALRYSQPYGTMLPGTPEDRASDVMPFAKAITENVELGVIAAIDVDAYASADATFRSELGKDPHYFAFYVAVSAILTHWTVPREWTIGLILDDDQEKAIMCYRFLKRLKRENAEIRKRVTSICFSDDKSSPQVQAADLFSYLCRIDAERRFMGKPHPYPSLWEAIDRPPTDGARLRIGGGFMTHENFRKFVESKRESRRTK